MLVHIQLRIPLFLYDTTWPEGTVLEVDEALARRLVALEQADIVTMTPPADPHQQPFQTATAPPPTERAATRTEPPDPKHHHKK